MITLSIVEFGDVLLKTGDLDPAYIAITSANLPQPTLAKLCLAYWCFYDLGTASRLAEVENSRFWAAMLTATYNCGWTEEGKRPWPRGSERRHFRGEQATRAMYSLHGLYSDMPPVDALMEFTGALHPSPTFSSVSKSVKTHRGFGDWIAFKVADMTERVLGVPVDFSNCELGIYKDPRQGAAVAFLERESTPERPMVFEDARGEEIPPWDYPISDDELRETVAYYVALWRRKKAKAPPTFDRLVNVQEIETIFCKYKSRLKGHYPVGKDTREITHTLQNTDSDVAKQLLKGLQNGA